MSASLSSVAGLILFAFKALPAANELWDKVTDGWQAYRAEQQRKQDHELIDSDRARITSAPWVCPSTCPHKLQHAAEAVRPAGPPPAPAV